MATHRTSSPSETHRLGVRLGSQIQPPRTVFLCGELGSGKTALVKGLAEGLGVEDPDSVHSPTFSLINEYPAPWGTIYHVDLYRLEGRREQDSVGLQEILDSDGVVIIEWAERLKLESDPPLHIEIRILDDDENGDGRIFRVRGLSD
ncbi:MAG: tRNA (adenosine(37)-N6)-threonylcarbamoyltransferase complex ATPase subunit type 1 TsaE [Acidobacteriota bacterium]